MIGITCQNLFINFNNRHKKFGGIMMDQLLLLPPQISSIFINSIRKTSLWLRFSRLRIGLALDALLPLFSIIWTSQVKYTSHFMESSSSTVMQTKSNLSWAVCSNKTVYTSLTRATTYFRYMFLSRHFHPY